MYNDAVFLFGGAGLFLTAIFGILSFIVKDVYTKVGELGALKERVRSLEGQVDDNKKTGESVIRIEEQIKSILNKVDLIMATLLKAKSND